MAVYQFNPNQEQWKVIAGFPGYEVSDRGRVRSFHRYHAGGAFISDSPQRFLKPWPTNSGYLGVRLSKNGKKTTRKIHRLVLESFIGYCPEGLIACHNNGKRIHNYLHNLRWDTRSSNYLDTIKHGTAPQRKGKKLKRRITTIATST